MGRALTWIPVPERPRVYEPDNMNLATDRWQQQYFHSDKKLNSIRWQQEMNSFFDQAPHDNVSQCLYESSIELIAVVIDISVNIKYPSIFFEYG